MALTRAEKESLIAGVLEKLKKQKSLVFAHYHGLTAAEVTDLRKALAGEGVEMQVVKNTLLTRALKEAGITTEGLTLSGPMAVAYSYEDEVAAAKVLSNFAKQHKALKLMAGILENKVLGKSEVVALAQLPTKQEMRARVVYTIAAPVSGFVRTLAGPTQQFVRALSQIAEKKSV